MSSHASEETKKTDELKFPHQLFEEDLDLNFENVEGRRRSKRSSILKLPKNMETDFCNTEEYTSQRKSQTMKRKVSFADTFQVMELHTGNIYDVPGNNDESSNRITSQELEQNADMNASCVRETELSRSLNMPRKHKIKETDEPVAKKKTNIFLPYGVSENTFCKLNFDVKKREILCSDEKENIIPGRFEAEECDMELTVFPGSSDMNTTFLDAEMVFQKVKKNLRSDINDKTCHFNSEIMELTCNFENLLEQSSVSYSDTFEEGPTKNIVNNNAYSCVNSLPVHSSSESYKDDQQLLKETLLNSSSKNISTYLNSKLHHQIVNTNEVLIIGAGNNDELMDNPNVKTSKENFKSASSVPKFDIPYLTKSKQEYNKMIDRNATSNLEHVPAFKLSNANSNWTEICDDHQRDGQIFHFDQNDKSTHHFTSDLMELTCNFENSLEQSSLKCDSFENIASKIPGNINVDVSSYREFAVEPLHKTFNHFVKNMASKCVTVSGNTNLHSQGQLDEIHSMDDKQIEVNSNSKVFSLDTKSCVESKKNFDMIIDKRKPMFEPCISKIKYPVKPQEDENDLENKAGVISHLEAINSATLSLDVNTDETELKNKVFSSDINDKNTHCFTSNVMELTCNFENSFEQSPLRLHDYLKSIISTSSVNSSTYLHDNSNLIGSPVPELHKLGIDSFHNYFNLCTKNVDWKPIANSSKLHRQIQFENVHMAMNSNEEVLTVDANIGTGLKEKSDSVSMEEQSVSMVDIPEDGMGCLMEPKGNEQFDKMNANMTSNLKLVKSTKLLDADIDQNHLDNTERKDKIALHTDVINKNTLHFTSDHMQLTCKCENSIEESFPCIHNLDDMSSKKSVITNIQCTDPSLADSQIFRIRKTDLEPLEKCFISNAKDVGLIPTLVTSNIKSGNQADVLDMCNMEHDHLAIRSNEEVLSCDSSNSKLIENSDIKVQNDILKINRKYLSKCHMEQSNETNVNVVPSFKLPSADHSLSLDEETQFNVDNQINAKTFHFNACDKNTHYFTSHLMELTCNFKNQSEQPPVWDHDNIPNISSGKKYVPDILKIDTNLPSNCHKNQLDETMNVSIISKHALHSPDHSVSLDVSIDNQTHAKPCFDPGDKNTHYFTSNLMELTCNSENLAEKFVLNDHNIQSISSEKRINDSICLSHNSLPADLAIAEARRINLSRRVSLSDYSFNTTTKNMDPESGAIMQNCNLCSQAQLGTHDTEQNNQAKISNEEFTNVKNSVALLKNSDAEINVEGSSQQLSSCHDNYKNISSEIDHFLSKNAVTHITKNNFEEFGTSTIHSRHKRSHSPCKSKMKILRAEVSRDHFEKAVSNTDLCTSSSLSDKLVLEIQKTDEPVKEDRSMFTQNGDVKLMTVTVNSKCYETHPDYVRNLEDGHLVMDSNNAVFPCEVKNSTELVETFDTVHKSKCKTVSYLTSQKDEQHEIINANVVQSLKHAKFPDMLSLDGVRGHEISLKLDTINQEVTAEKYSSNSVRNLAKMSAPNMPNNQVLCNYSESSGNHLPSYTVCKTDPVRKEILLNESKNLAQCSNASELIRLGSRFMKQTNSLQTGILYAIKQMKKDVYPYINGKVDNVCYFPEQIFSAKKELRLKSPFSSPQISFSNVKNSSFQHKDQSFLKGESFAIFSNYASHSSYESVHANKKTANVESHIKCINTTASKNESKVSHSLFDVASFNNEAEKVDQCSLNNDNALYNNDNKILLSGPKRMELSNSFELGKICKNDSKIFQVVDSSTNKYEDSLQLLPNSILESSISLNAFCCQKNTISVYNANSFSFNKTITNEDHLEMSSKREITTSINGENSNLLEKSTLLPPDISEHPKDETSKFFHATPCTKADLSRDGSISIVQKKLAFNISNFKPNGNESQTHLTKFDFSPTRPSLSAICLGYESLNAENSEANVGITCNQLASNVKNFEVYNSINAGTDVNAVPTSMNNVILTRNGSEQQDVPILPTQFNFSPTRHSISEICSVSEPPNMEDGEANVEITCNQLTSDVKNFEVHNSINAVPDVGVILTTDSNSVVIAGNDNEQQGVLTLPTKFTFSPTRPSDMAICSGSELRKAEISQANVGIPYNQFASDVRNFEVHNSVNAVPDINVILTTDTNSMVLTRNGSERQDVQILSTKFNLSPTRPSERTICSGNVVLTKNGNELQILQTLPTKSHFSPTRLSTSATCSESELLNIEINEASVGITCNQLTSKVQNFDVHNSTNAVPNVNVNRITDTNSMVITEDLVKNPDVQRSFEAPIISSSGSTNLEVSCLIRPTSSEFCNETSFQANKISRKNNSCVNRNEENCTGEEKGTALALRLIANQDLESVDTIKCKLMQFPLMEKRYWILRKVDEKQAVFSLTWGHWLYKCSLLIQIPCEHSISNGSQISFQRLDSDSRIRDLGHELFLSRVKSTSILPPVNSEKILKLLEEYSNVLSSVESLMLDISHVSVKHQYSYNLQDTLKLTVEVLNRSRKSIFSLTFLINLQLYPYDRIVPEVNHLSCKKIRKDVILQALLKVEPGKNYLWNMVKEAEVV